MAKLSHSGNNLAKLFMRKTVSVLCSNLSEETWAVSNQHLHKNRKHNSHRKQNVVAVLVSCSENKFK